MTSACTNRCSATDRLSAAKPIAACDDGPRDGWRLKVEDAAKGASSSGSILAVHSCQQGELRQVNFSGARLARLTSKKRLSLMSIFCDAHLPAANLSFVEALGAISRVTISSPMPRHPDPAAVSLAPMTGNPMACGYGRET